MDQKLEQARVLKDRLGVKRPILMDALDGACHRAYGSVPNMSWVFARSGVPLYKSDWTDAASIENTIQYFLNVVNRRRKGGRMVPFRVERLDYRDPDQEAFDQGLKRNGPRALKEFYDFMRASHSQ